MQLESQIHQIKTKQQTIMQRLNHHPLTPSHLSMLPGPRAYAIDVEGTNLATALPSDQILTHKLHSVVYVLLQYKTLTKYDTKAEVLPQSWPDKLFGVDVMKLCTPLRNRELPGQPVAELNQLK